MSALWGAIEIVALGCTSLAITMGGMFASPAVTNLGFVGNYKFLAAKSF